MHLLTSSVRPASSDQLYKMQQCFSGCSVSLSGMPGLRPISSTGLYWSIRGHVACERHIPDAADPVWVRDGWSAVPAKSQGDRGRYYQCEYCSPQSLSVHTSPGMQQWAVGLTVEEQRSGVDRRKHSRNDRR